MNIPDNIEVTEKNSAKQVNLSLFFLDSAFFKKVQV